MHYRAPEMNGLRASDHPFTPARYFSTADPRGSRLAPAGCVLWQDGSPKGMRRLRICGLLVARILNATSLSAEWRAKQDKAGTRLRELLEPFGVSTWQELEDRVNHRERIAPDLLGAKAQCAAALGNDALDELEDRLSKMAAKRDELFGMEPSWAENLPDVEALRAEIGALKLQMENAQNEARAEWQNAERLCAGGESLAATTANACAANESTLAQANNTLAVLEADGLTIPERQEKLADRRRECETAEDALRDIDRKSTRLNSSHR